MPNASAAYPAKVEGLHGPAFSNSAACASSGMAIINAYQMIQTDECDVVVTGGNEDSLDPISNASFANARATSTRNETPEKALRPFDITRDGFVQGEGAASLVLESLEHARERGAHILAEILGVARNNDSYSIVHPQPDGLWQALCMKTALIRANALDSVGYINAHGTGTLDGDETEALSIAKTLKERSGEVWVSSTKPITGHMMSAAAAIELLITVMVVQKGVIPPTTNLTKVDPTCLGLRHVMHRPIEQKVEVASSDSFGFGGHNTCIVVGRYRE